MFIARPLATFMKNKRRRKGGSDSDLSDREMTPSGSGIDDDTLQLLQVILESVDSSCNAAMHGIVF